MTERGRRGRPGIRYEKPCATCGKIMRVVPSQLHRQNCSWACRSGRPERASHADIIRRYRDGDLIREIEQAVGVSNTYIYHVLQAHGIPRDRPHVGRPPKPRVAVPCQRCRAPIWCRPAMVEQVRYCSSDCSNAEKEAPDAAEIVARYLAGEKIRRIMAIHGTTAMSIYRALHRRGIVPNRWHREEGNP